jgi:WD40 repeat protein
MRVGDDGLRRLSATRGICRVTLVAFPALVACTLPCVAGAGELSFTRHPALKWRRTLRFEPGSDRQMAFAADGRHLAAAIRDDAGVRIRMWDTANGIVTHNWQTADWYPSAIALSPDGKHLACALHRFGPNGKAWETKVQLLTLDYSGGKVVHVSTGSAVGDQAVASMAFSSDGHSLAILAPLSLRVRDVPSGRESVLLETGTGGADSVVFSPDGKLLAAAMDTEVRVLEIASRTWRNRWKLPYGVPSVAFSPDGTMLAAIVNDEPAKVWDLATAKLKQSVPVEGNQAVRIAFTRAGNKLLTFSTKLEGGQSREGIGRHGEQPERIVSNHGGVTKGIVQLWDLQKNLAKTDLIPPTDLVQNSAFCPLTGLLGTCGGDDDARIELWDIGNAGK